MSKHKSWKVHLPKIIGGVIGSILVALIIYGISNFKQDSDERPQKKIQPITLLKPPPPPPPPKIEKPPEPEKIEEKIPEPDPEPENLPDIDDAPPADSLGLDADGSAGSDGFGLAARKGGRGLLSGNPNAWYGNIIRNQMQVVISEVDDLRRTRYTATVRIWVDKQGNVTRFELVRGSDDARIDEKLQMTLAKLKRINKPPPAGMKQPIKFRITNRI
ncbi:energy transducer TonB family protein [Methylotuvimicrobium alcaliphilum]|uniref:TonB-dependent receptor n=1 Tax=Methylotuvimicrobium alcaliphilum (strain DSM 19304 / NCIMB 14124 / VKM B-2133 / 20Z) TaxID=1091494 RepID=G4T1X7_META2|nr:energy transducer TonB [Methylotuvimicrobium alcaliphilum]CCE24651.1 putative TonB-dependent receptor [Methylotuvimicrobium alcaliphilum 20Z]